MSLDRKIEHAESILRNAFAEHEPVAVLAGFSGGHDSLVATHLTAQVFPQMKAFHGNTGIGIEKTRIFVRETCEAYGWSLVEIMAKEDCGQDYREMVVEYGFPGPPMHAKMYQRLKGRCVEHAVREEKKGHGRFARIMIATGIRKDESQRRMGYDSTIVDRKGAQVWVNPIYYFTSDDKNAYIQRFDLPRNKVVDTLGMSGECLCGAFAHKGEKELVRLVDPEAARYIDELEEEVFAAGWKWGWEEGPSKALILEKYGQLHMRDSLYAQERAYEECEAWEEAQSKYRTPMCVGCEKIHDEREAA